jgi:hypothetical protein
LKTAIFKPLAEEYVTKKHGICGQEAQNMWPKNAELSLRDLWPKDLGLQFALRKTLDWKSSTISSITWAQTAF